MDSKIIGSIIGLVLALYVATAMLPGAISTMTAINASSSSGYGFWGSTVTSLWGLVPLFAMIALVMIVYKFVSK